jgi:5-enolpyruvylshikimate-3-phosphate synthase
MSLMIASLRSQGDILIHHAEAINKSYPSFISEMTNLGARIKKEVTNY